MFICTQRHASKTSEMKKLPCCASFIKWIMGKYNLVCFSLCRKHVTLESGHNNQSLAKRVSNICRDKVINGCSPGWKQGWNGHIRDMFSKQFTAVKKTKNRNILYKCTYDTFYITTHYTDAATWLIGNNLQYTLTISKLLFFSTKFYVPLSTH